MERKTHYIGMRISQLPILALVGKTPATFDKHDSLNMQRSAEASSNHHERGFAQSNSLVASTFAWICSLPSRIRLSNFASVRILLRPLFIHGCHAFRRCRVRVGRRQFTTKPCLGYRNLAVGKETTAPVITGNACTCRAVERAASLGASQRASQRNSAHGAPSRQSTVKYLASLQHLAFARWMRRVASPRIRSDKTSQAQKVRARTTLAECFAV